MRFPKQAGVSPHRAVGVNSDANHMVIAERFPKQIPERIQLRYMDPLTPWAQRRSLLPPLLVLRPLFSQAAKGS